MEVKLAGKLPQYKVTGKNRQALTGGRYSGGCLPLISVANGLLDLNKRRGNRKQINATIMLRMLHNYTCMYIADKLCNIFKNTSNYIV